MPTFNESDILALGNICTTVAIRFREIAEIMEKEPGHAALAVQFEDQAKQADEFALRLADCDFLVQP